MMSHKDQNRLGDRIIFWFAASVAFMFFTQAVYDFGFSHGQAVPKVCAAVPGEQVISSTADGCTYANAYGRATMKRMAM